LTFWLTLFTLLATWTAVVYTFFESRQAPRIDSVTDETIKYVMLQCNLIMPLLATVVKGILSILNPLSKSNALKDAAASIESEVYLYRSKVGKYNPSRQSSDAGTPSSKQPRLLFSAAIDEILTTASDGEIKTASLENPSDMNTQSVLDEVNHRIKANRADQEAYLAPMPAGSGGLLGLLSFGMISGPAAKTRGGRSCCSCFGSQKVAPGQIDKKLSKNFDDGLSTLSAEEYVQFRLLPMLGEISSSTPGLNFRVYGVSITVTILSVSSSALSTFGQSLFIPAMLAFSGAITSWTSYQRTDQLLLQKNIAVGNLHQLLIWWDGLTMIEKRVPTNKNALVLQAERAIMAQATTLGTGGGTTMIGANSADRDEDGHKGDKKGDAKGKGKPNKGSESST
jgi:hypothetical protein